MTSAPPPANPSAAKLGGIALIGVGALAAVFGVATAVSGGSEQEAAPQPSHVPVPAPMTSQAPAPSQSPPPQQVVPPQIPPPPVQPPAPESLPAAPNPPNVVQQPGQADLGQPAQNVAKIVVRVYNNSTIKGLANRAADDFRQAGYDVPEVGNYSQGRIYTTTVYFEPGTPEEAQAQEVAARFGARVEPRFDGIRSSSPGIIAIITNDYKGPVGK